MRSVETQAATDSISGIRWQFESAVLSGQRPHTLQLVDGQTTRLAGGEVIDGGI